MNASTMPILLVDDDDVEAEAVYRSFARRKIANPIVRARDGEEALRLLRATGHSGVAQGPYLVLLDLNMPRMDGFEFLAELRADAALLDTVVFVLTTSTADEDRASAYRKQVAGYIVKSNAGYEFESLVALLARDLRAVGLAGGAAA